MQIIFVQSLFQNKLTKPSNFRRNKILQKNRLMKSVIFLNTYTNKPNSPNVYLNINLTQYCIHKLQLFKLVKNLTLSYTYSVAYNQDKYL